MAEEATKPVHATERYLRNQLKEFDTLETRVKEELREVNTLCQKLAKDVKELIEVLLDDSNLPLLLDPSSAGEDKAKTIESTVSVCTTLINSANEFLTEWCDLKRPKHGNYAQDNFLAIYDRLNSLADDDHRSALPVWKVKEYDMDELQSTFNDFVILHMPYFTVIVWVDGRHENNQVCTTSINTKNADIVFITCDSPGDLLKLLTKHTSYLTGRDAHGRVRIITASAFTSEDSSQTMTAADLLKSLSEKKFTVPALIYTGKRKANVLRNSYGHLSKAYGSCCITFMEKHLMNFVTMSTVFWIGTQDDALTKKIKNSGIALYTAEEEKCSASKFMNDLETLQEKENVIVVLNIDANMDDKTVDEHAKDLIKLYAKSKCKIVVHTQRDVSSQTIDRLNKSDRVKITKDTVSGKRERSSICCLAKVRHSRIDSCIMMKRTPSLQEIIDAPKSGTLHITSISCADLKPKDAGVSSDPYVTLVIKGNARSKIKTSVIKKNLNPVWKGLDWKIQAHTTDTLTLEVFDWYYYPRFVAWQQTISTFFLVHVLTVCLNQCHQ